MVTSDDERREALSRQIMEWSMAQDENDERTKPTIWERIEGSARGPRPTLTHEQIGRAAIEIADADGADGVSMRRLAERLGIATMGLYRYVAGKEDVYELMIDAAHAEASLPSGGWRDVAAALARETRTVILRHPWLIEVTARTPSSLTPATVAVIEQALTSIDGLGVEIDAMMAAFGTVSAFARGMVAGEVAQNEALKRMKWDSAEDPRLAFLPWVRWMLGTGRYPMLTRYVVEGSNEDDAEWQFEFGLECVLDGIAARLGI
jgi:AcrR family transcriptional regulator